MFQFARKGVIEVSEKGDEAMMAALDAGAEDVVDEDEGTVIYTSASDLMKVRQALVDAGLNVTSAELQYVPTSYVPVEGENAEKLEKLLSAIDELDDVVTPPVAHLALQADEVGERIGQPRAAARQTDVGGVALPFVAVGHQADLVAEVAQRCSKRGVQIAIFAEEQYLHFYYFFKFLTFF